MKKKNYHIDYKNLFIARFPEEWVIFSLKDYRSHILNKTACLVFELIEKGRDIDEISSCLSKSLIVACPKIKNEVKKLYADFKREGILVKRSPNLQSVSERKPSTGSGLCPE